MEKVEEVTVMKKNVDGRSAIEAKGQQIILSVIKPRIETLLTDSAIEEGSYLCRNKSYN